MQPSPAVRPVLFLSAALLLPALAPGARGADAQKLLFTSSRGGNFDIYLAGPDAADAKNLSSHAGEESAPCWSPDGKRFAFVSNRAGNRDIYVADADGGSVKQLTTDPAEERTPGWSPDGKQLVFIRQIQEMNWDADPTWSPDGKRILFVSLGPGDERFRFKTVGPAGGDLQDGPAVDNLLGWIYAAWSPDGKKLAYGGLMGEAVELFTCDADGGNRKQLTSLKGVNTYPAWSPDGKQIAFQHHDAPEAAGSLHVIDADGGNDRQVTPAECPLEGGRPAWKPRG